MDLSAGSCLGHYEILGLLGGSGMGWSIARATHGWAARSVDRSIPEGAFPMERLLEIAIGLTEAVAA